VADHLRNQRSEMYRLVNIETGQILKTKSPMTCQSNNPQKQRAIGIQPPLGSES
jgi:hypothetical protein